MPPKGKGGKGGGKGAPGGKSVVVEMEVETDKEKFICNLLKKLLPGVGTEELELGECFLMSLLLMHCSLDCCNLPSMQLIEESAVNPSACDSAFTTVWRHVRTHAHTHQHTRTHARPLSRAFTHLTLGTGLCVLLWRHGTGAYRCGNAGRGTGGAQGSRGQ